MDLTLKHKLIITAQQEEILIKISDECRKCYNHFLEEYQEHNNFYHKEPTYYDLQKRLKDYNTEYLTFDLKKEVLRNLFNNIKSYYSLLKTNKKLNPQFPKFRGHKYFYTISVTESFIINNNKLTLSYLNRGRLDFKLSYLKPIENLSCLRRKTEDSDIKCLKIYKEDNNYFASITYNKKEKEVQKSNDILVMDLGQRNLVTSYSINKKEVNIFNSKFLNNNKKYYDKRINELKSLRDKKTKNSLKHKKLNLKIKTLYNKRKRQDKLVLHKLSRHIINQNKTIVLGELTNIKQNIISSSGNYWKDKNVNRTLQNNWNIMTFINLLEYKSKLEGIELIKVNEAYTSKTCSHCNAVDMNFQDDKIFRCNNCLQEIHRDINGVLNISKQIMGFYNEPLEVLKTSERFGWAKPNQMNLKYNFEI